jgi:hypothetical protein
MIIRFKTICRFYTILVTKGYLKICVDFYEQLKAELRKPKDDMLKLLTRAMHTSGSGRLPHLKSTLRYEVSLLQTDEINVRSYKIIYRAHFCN